MKSTWPIDTRVFPVFAGLINASISGIRHTDGVVEMPCSFECEPTTTYGNTPIGGATPMYRDEELFLGKLNWISRLTFEFDSDREKIDLNTGTLLLVLLVAVFTADERPQLVHHWSCARDGVPRLAGSARRRGPPGLHADRQYRPHVLSDPLIAASSIEVEDTDYATLVATIRPGVTSS